jgi:hypothetical protein
MESGQHSRGHGVGDGQEWFPRNRSARERPEKEIGRSILVFFLVVEREREEKEMVEVDEPFPQSPFTHLDTPRAIVLVQGPVVPLLVFHRYYAGTAALESLF